MKGSVHSRAPSRSYSIVISFRCSLHLMPRSLPDRVKALGPQSILETAAGRGVLILKA